MAQRGELVAELPTPPGVAFVPAGDVLLLAVTLPRMSAAQRQRAAAFAIEDRVAQPLEAVHVIVIGPAPAPETWLIAVVGKGVLAAHAAHNPAPLRLVPEMLALPVPPPGSACVWCGAARAVLRLPDGSGFAVPRALLPVALRLAGAPALLTAGAPLPDGLAGAPLDLPADAVPPGVDLRHANQPRAVAPGLRRLGLLAAGVVAAHIGLMAAGAAVLSARADRAEADLRAALVAAGRPVAGDIDAALVASLAPPRASGQGGFLRLFGVVSAELAVSPDGAVLRDLSYDDGTGRLSLTVEAPGLAALQALQAGLADRGLTATAEASESTEGLAVMRLSVAGGAP